MQESVTINKVSMLLVFLQALDRCKDQEQKIEALQGPLEQLRKEAQTDFDRVRTCLHCI